MSWIPLRLVLSLPTSVGGMDLERTGSMEALPTLLKGDPRELQTSRLMEREKRNSKWKYPSTWRMKNDKMFHLYNPKGGMEFLFLQAY